MNTCCPPDYYYNGAGCCANGAICSNISQTIPTVACGCCPEGYLFIDQSGYYDDVVTGNTLIVNTVFSSPTFLECVGKCGLFRNHAYVSSLISNIECPCCPTAYSYDAKSGMCSDGKGSMVNTVSCIPIICPDEVIPDPCPTCTNGTLPITFTYNQDVKNCINCIPLGDMVTRPFTKFIADILIDPIVNFFRK